MQWIHVERDSFARETLTKRRTYYGIAGGCKWCGGLRTSRHAKPRPYLFQFRTESDGGRNTELTGLFCSRSCLKAYN